jgi:hypothetical protein
MNVVLVGQMDISYVQRGVTKAPGNTPPAMQL